MKLPTAAREIDGGQTIGYVAAHLPGATGVFRRLKLDFCCAGDMRLDEAIGRKGLDVDAILEELRRLSPGEAGIAAPDDPALLIDHILDRYHRVHKQELPELLQMAHRVELVHKGHPQVPGGLAGLLEGMLAELTQHMAKEEQILFPLLKQGGHPMVRHPITMMRHEHVEHGNALQRLQELTNDMQPPADACNTWRALYIGLEKFKDDLMNHIHLENNVLFPAFERGSCGGGGGGGCGCG